MRSRWIGAACALLVATHGAGAAPDAVQKVCVGCHGLQGEGNAQAGYPRLAGLDRRYLAKQLRDFAAGQRSNPVMEPIAKQLSPTQIDEAAGWYASRPRTAAKEPAKRDEAAQRLALQGDWSRNLPPCFQCHGPRGDGVPPHFPAITGQPSKYTAAQLQAWKAGTRRNDPLGLMQAVAHRLSDAEIAALARYLESVPRAQETARR